MKATKPLSTSFFLLVAKYRDYLNTRNYAVRTVKEYPDALCHFLKYLESISIFDVREVTFCILRGFLQEHAHLNPGTQKGKVDLIKNFFRFLHKTGEIYINVSLELDSPKLPKRLPRGILEVAEIKAILKQPNVNTVIGIRDRAILELLYSTGIRNSELCGLRLSDISLEEQRFFILGKGRKEAYVPFGEKAKEALRNYLLRGRPRLKPSGDYFFISRWSGTKMSGVGLLDMVKRYAKAAGIEKNVFPHAFRHSCATHLLRNGADIRHIQELLRHADLSSTQVYTRVDVTDLKEAQKKYHPREQDG